MKVRLVGLKRPNAMNSMDKVAASYVRALGDGGGQPIDTSYEVYQSRRFSSRGGLLEPYVNIVFARFEHQGTEIIHAVEPELGFRGVDVVTSHGCYGLKAGRTENRFMDGLTVFQHGQAYRHAKRVVCVGEHVRDEITGEWPELKEKTSVVHLPFEAQAWRDVRLRDVLWVGFITPRKDPALLLQALREPALEGRRVTVKLVGKKWPAYPKYARRFEEEMGWLASRNVERDDFLTEPELEAAYRTSGCVVATSSHEGWQAVPYEAWIRGTPVVLPMEPFYLKQFQGAPGVYWFRPGEASGLATAVRSALEGEPFRPDPNVVRQHTFAHCGEELRAVYEGLSGR